MGASEAGAAGLTFPGRFEQGLFSGYEQQRIAVEAGKAALQLVDEVIAAVNNGELPEHHMLQTNTGKFAPLWALPPDIRAKHRPGPRYPAHGTRIYRPDVSGKYAVDGELATIGDPIFFLGDRLHKFDDGSIIIINRGEEVGMDIGDNVYVVETPRDPLRGDVLSSHSYTLGIIKSVHGGTKKQIDTLYQ